MLTPITVKFSTATSYSPKMILDFLVGRNGWLIVTDKWPVFGSGVHVIKSTCIGAMVTINKTGYIVISPYVGTLIGSLNPLSFILYKKEMMEHARLVSECVIELVSSDSMPPFPDSNIHAAT